MAWPRGFRGGLGPIPSACQAAVEGRWPGRAQQAVPGQDTGVPPICLRPARHVGKNVASGVNCGWEVGHGRWGAPACELLASAAGWAASGDETKTGPSAESLAGPSGLVDTACDDVVIFGRPGNACSLHCLALLVCSQVHEGSAHMASTRRPKVQEKQTDMD